MGRARDKKLNELKLKTKMPKEFYDGDLQDNEWARYLVIQIDICDIFWNKQTFYFDKKMLKKI